MIVDLPKSHYRILNAPAPSRWAIVGTMAAIVAVSVAWAVFGGLTI